MKLIAHRGDRANYPENTIKAIQSALSYPIQGIEFDVELTRDEHLIILHQETLENKGGRLEPAGLKLTRRWLNQIDFSEVKKIDAGSWLSDEFVGIKIPTLLEVLELNWSQSIYLELKDPYYWEDRNIEYEEALIRKIQEDLSSVGTENLKICSYNYHLLINLRKLGYDCPMGVNTWYDHGASLEEAISCHQEIGLDYIAFRDEYLLENKGDIIKVVDAGVKVASFPFSEYDQDGHLAVSQNHLSNIQELENLGVEYFFVDDLSLISSLLG